MQFYGRVKAKHSTQLVSFAARITVGALGALR